MTFRIPAVAAAVLAVVADTAAFAQPVAPAPRPTFSSYSSLYRPGGGYYGYGGGSPYGGYGGGSGGFGYGGQMGQNLLLQQQLALTNQNLQGVQSFLATGGVNANLPYTGRGATFNSLGHWYPSSRYGGGIGGGGGGFTAPRGAGFGAMGGGAGGNSGGGRTAGNGIPVGGGGSGQKR